jgi:serine/threonine protein kinase
MKYFVQLVLAFKEVHDAKLIHKNVSATNVLLKKLGLQKIVKLISFKKAEEEV